MQKKEKYEKRGGGGTANASGGGGGGGGAPGTGGGGWRARKSAVWDVRIQYEINEWMDVQDLLRCAWRPGSGCGWRWRSDGSEPFCGVGVGETNSH